MAQKPYYNTLTTDTTYLHNSAWVEQLIVHDSNFGPYMKLQKDFFHKENLRDLEIIVPLPKKVYARGQDVEPYAFALIRHSSIRDRLNKMLELNNTNGLTQLVKDFINALDNNNLILRTYLIESKEFVTNYAGHLGKLYSKVPMPKMVWVTEISIPSFFTESYRLGEVITDGTAMMGLEVGFVAAHVPGLLVIRDITKEKIEIFPLPSDKPVGIMK